MRIKISYSCCRALFLAGMNMKIVIASIILFSFSVIAEESITGEETPINNTTELKLWCKNKSSEHFLAQGITPYNWTDSWWTESEFLFVKGSWRVDTKDYVVLCTIRRGVAEKYASWKFIEEE